MPPKKTKREASLWILPFGNHLGEPIEDQQTRYLNYLIEQDWFCAEYPNGLKQVQAELNYRKTFGG